MKPAALLLDEVHDGLASEGEVRRFETELARSAELRAELALQRELDRRLHALFAADPASSIAALPDVPARGRRIRSIAWFALAAAAGFVAWLGFRAEDAGPNAPPLGASWHACIAALDPAEPAPLIEACTTELPMAVLTRSTLGTPLELPAGWRAVRATSSASTGLPERILVLRVTSPEARSAVLVLRADDPDTRLGLPSEAGLVFARRTIAGIDCLEIVSEGAPFVLAALAAARE